jgi:hypothetical protein
LRRADAGALIEIAERRAALASAAASDVASVRGLDATALCAALPLAEQDRARALVARLTGSAERAARLGESNRRAATRALRVVRALIGAGAPAGAGYGPRADRAAPSSFSRRV